MNKNIKVVKIKDFIETLNSFSIEQIETYLDDRKGKLALTIPKNLDDTEAYLSRKYPLFMNRYSCLSCLPKPGRFGKPENFGPIF